MKQKIHNQVILLIQDINVDQNYDCRKAFEEGLKYCNWANGYYNPSKMEFTDNEIKGIITSNIRHRHSNYENILRSMDKITRDMDDEDKIYEYRQIKNATLSRIQRSYPFLESYCESQKYSNEICRIIKHKSKSKKK